MEQGEGFEGIGFVSIDTTEIFGLGLGIVDELLGRLGKRTTGIPNEVDVEMGLLVR